MPTPCGVLSFRLNAVAVAAFATTAALAQTVFNTGLGGPGTADPHWTLTPTLPATGATGLPPAVTLSPGNYFPGGGGYLPYVTDDAHSRWDADQDSTSNPGTVGSVYYSQNFLSPGAVGTVSGRYAGADILTNVYIDGIAVGTDGAGAGPISYVGNTGDPWDQWHAFNYSGALNPGVNTISFEITSPETLYNGFNAQFNAVPEPAPFAILCGGTALCVIRRKPRCLRD